MNSDTVNADPLSYYGAESARRNRFSPRTKF